VKVIIITTKKPGEVLKIMLIKMIMKLLRNILKKINVIFVIKNLEKELMELILFLL
jgi:hypothetical protein